MTTKNQGKKTSIFHIFKYELVFVSKEDSFFVSSALFEKKNMWNLVMTLCNNDSKVPLGFT